MDNNIDVFSIENDFSQLETLLKEIKRKTMNAPISFYGNFFHHKKASYCSEAVRAAYEERKMRVGKLTFERLKEMHTKVVEEFLSMHILRYALPPTQHEMSQVRLDKVREYLPSKYKLSDDFEEQCALFRRFISWEGEVLKIDYDSLGQYLFLHYYLFPEEERNAFFHLDLMLELIHLDMMRVNTAFKEERRDLLPEALASDEAMIFWRRLQENHFVDDKFQLCADISRKQAMYIADLFAERLKLKNKWRLFEELWNIKNMAQERWEMQQTGVLPTRYQEIDRIFSE